MTKTEDKELDKIKRKKLKEMLKEYSGISSETKIPLRISSKPLNFARATK